MINEEECFEKGLLKRTSPQSDLSKKDLKQAEFFLKESEELLDLGKKQIAALSLYNAFFHAARALLFKDGIKERSHYCMVAYLIREFSANDALRNLLNILDNYRQIRNTAQYEGMKIHSTEAKNALIDAEDFITEVEKYLKGAKSNGKN